MLNAADRALLRSLLEGAGLLAGQATATAA
jgi:hypothetical protein